MTSKEEEKNEVYTIPQNFIDTGTLFGGTIKIRNAIEAGLFIIVIGYIVFHLGISLYYKIIVSCLTVLPVTLLAVIGINGESLSSFIINFFKFLRNRRIIGIETPEKKQKSLKSLKAKKAFTKTNNQNLIVTPKKQNLNLSEITAKKADKAVLGKRKDIKSSILLRTLNPIANFIPIKKVEHGIIYTTDGRYVKIIEVVPINFLLRSAKEQRNIIYSFISYLKVSPVKFQIKVFTKSADINKHLEKIQIEFNKETDERCRALQEDYANLIYELGSKEAITRRFFFIFQYEPYLENRNKDKEALAIAEINTAVNSARTYLRHCGNDVIHHENENEFAVNVFYNLLNRKTSVTKPLPKKINEVIEEYKNLGWYKELKEIPVTEFIAPLSIDLTHGNFIKIDGVYTAYMVIPSDGFKNQVLAGWTSLLVNAGEGIDIDLFFTKERKDKIQQKLGQQIRINRSKIKDTQDTNSDFDDLESAIHSGYYLKRGLSNNQDFYYANILITITGDTVDEINWRVREMKKLLRSQDLDVHSCLFRHEQSFLSSLPLLNLDKTLHNMTKRNMLTTGVASCYPFTSFEMCDDNGILLGVNRHNNSLIIVDIFNSKIYKNANIAILGTSGAGKTFTMQLMALRMRRKHIQVFIVVPLKGHECAPRFVVNSIW